MILTVTSQNVLLPDLDQPTPATISIDVSTGKVIDIQLRYAGGACNASGEPYFVDAGDKVVLPGLVEWALFLVLKHSP